jgi:hypothetical protein
LLASGNLDTLAVGPVLLGPINSSLGTLPGTSRGDLIVTVYCPVGATPCDAAQLPATTVYTYVVTITPRNDTPNSPGYPQPPAGGSRLDEYVLTQFAPKGIVGIGYSETDARKALLDAGAGPVSTCLADGRIAWRVLPGYIKGRWEGQTIRFYFQAGAPAGDGSYKLAGPDGNGTGPAPAPASAGNDCSTLPAR